MCRPKQTQQRMSEVLIGMFEESGSFADAKNNMGLLEEIGTWQPTFSTRYVLPLKQIHRYKALGAFQNGQRLWSINGKQKVLSRRNGSK